MNIRKENGSLTISAWDQKDPINRTFFSGLLFLLVYFFLGFEASCFALVTIILIDLTVHYRECQTNYASVRFDFQTNTIVLVKSFLGFTLYESELNRIDFNKLVFNEYHRNRFGQKKYQLEYHTPEKTSVLYRVDDAVQKMIIEKELKNEEAKLYDSSRKPHDSLSDFSILNRI